eukprot:6592090-Pyramimonas_sp.AAC.1
MQAHSLGASRAIPNQLPIGTPSLPSTGPALGLEPLSVPTHHSAPTVFERPQGIREGSQLGGGGLGEHARQIAEAKNAQHNLDVKMLCLQQHVVRVPARAIVVSPPGYLTGGFSIWLQKLDAEFLGILGPQRTPNAPMEQQFGGTQGVAKPKLGLCFYSTNPEHRFS